MKRDHFGDSEMIFEMVESTKQRKKRCEDEEERSGEGK
jgi:hypothetical protein